MYTGFILPIQSFRKRYLCYRWLRQPYLYLVTPFRQPSTGVGPINQQDLSAGRQEPLVGTTALLQPHPSLCIIEGHWS